METFAELLGSVKLKIDIAQMDTYVVGFLQSCWDTSNTYIEIRCILGRGGGGRAGGGGHVTWKIKFRVFIFQINSHHNILNCFGAVT